MRPPVSPTLPINPLLAKKVLGLIVIINLQVGGPGHLFTQDQVLSKQTQSEWLNLKGQEVYNFAANVAIYHQKNQSDVLFIFRLGDLHIRTMCI